MPAIIGRMLMKSEENINTFDYYYEDRLYLRFDFDCNQSVRMKKDAAGDVLSDPPLHQLVFGVKSDCNLTVTVFLKDGIVMRPQRAVAGEAILSQNGKPLIYGVNGLYDKESDTYLSWYGAQWWYNNKRVQRENGGDVISFTVEMKAGKPFVFNIQQRFYQKTLGFKYHDPRSRRYNDKPICGWCSWEAYRKEIDEGKIGETAKFLAEKLKPYGMEYMQIDDGFQPEYMPPEGCSLAEGWARTNEKFPGGHGELVRIIKDAGFIPAIWNNVVINNFDYAKNSGMCFKGADGEPLHDQWIHYVFDCIEESLIKEIVPIFKTFYQYGYRYFKVDALRHIYYDGMALAVREGIITSEEANDRFRSLYVKIREAIGGDSYFLSCWGVMTQGVGVIDALRFATDAKDNERSFYLLVDESARWHHTHGILYRNDPDHLCMRSPFDMASSISAMASLNGYLYMISDEISCYTDDKLALIRQTIPPTDTITAETGSLNIATPMNYYGDMDQAHCAKESLMPGSLWVTHFVKGDRVWAVINLINKNPDNKKKKTVINLEKLQLDPAKKYIAFDFYAQKPIGFIERSLTVNTPVLYGNKVIALTEYDGNVQFIGSSRHVSCDSISVTDVQKTENGLKLSLSGVEDTCDDYWFVLPENVKCDVYVAGAKIINNENHDRYLKVSVLHLITTEEIDIICKK